MTTIASLHMLNNGRRGREGMASRGRFTHASATAVNLDTRHKQNEKALKAPVGIFVAIKVITRLHSRRGNSN